MSIAQRSVAGEGESHPRQTAELEVPNDSAALAAFRCDSVNLPWIIFRATFRANHIGQLPQRARAVLAALARTVDANRPFGVIFARRELLTGRAMQSMRTFYRSLDDLESAGLIQRGPQSRYVEMGRFGRSNLYLTQRAAAILGLVEPILVPTTVAPSGSAPKPSHKTPDQAQDQRALPFAGPTAKMADGAIYKDLSPGAFQKRQPGQVPSDLQRLRSLGFHDFLTFKLMREAREHGKRLSDVVEATWDHLKLANTPICYLRSLIASTVDFSMQVRRRLEARQAVQRKHAEERAAFETVQKAAGKVFVRIDGKTRYAVSDDGSSLTVQQVDEPTQRVAAGTWQISFADALLSGRIREATHESVRSFEEAFMQGRNALQASTARREVEPDAGPLTSLPRALTPGGRDSLASLKAILGMRKRNTQHETVSADHQVAVAAVS